MRKAKPPETLKPGSKQEAAAFKRLKAYLQKCAVPQTPLTGKVVVLAVMTWAGSVVSYAKHYYGRLYPDGAHVASEATEVEVELSLEQQRVLNKEDGAPASCVYEGRTSSRFESEEAMLAAALPLAKKTFGENVILFKGWDHLAWDLNPVEMLLGPEPLRTEANKAWKVFEDAGGFGPTGWTREQDRAASKRAEAWRRTIAPVLRLAGKKS